MIASTISNTGSFSPMISFCNNGTLWVEVIKRRILPFLAWKLTIHVFCFNRRFGLLSPVPVFGLCLLCLLLLRVWYHGINKHLFIQMIWVHVKYFVLVIEDHSKVKIIVVSALGAWPAFWCLYFSYIISVHINICTLFGHLVRSVALTIWDNITWERAPNYIAIIINCTCINFIRPAGGSRIVPCKLIRLLPWWEVIIKGTDFVV